MNENDMPSKLLWVDLEMTGLDPAKQRIIEVAAIVTDFKLEELDSYETIIHQPAEVLDAAESWPKENMKPLFKEVAESSVAEAEAVSAVMKLVNKYWDEEKIVLAGNSIHQDRRFIRQWWPDLESKLHYRMFDVSAFKIWVQGALNLQYEKKGAHRAMDDIRESIAELSWCMEKING